jgi:hypothetical protein
MLKCFWLKPPISYHISVSNGLILRVESRQESFIISGKAAYPSIIELADRAAPIVV